MSKTVIRNGMFETNSSSVHSICISKKPVKNVKGKKIAFYLGEYGWEYETVDTPDYLYTAIMCQSNSEELLDKLKSILDKYEIDYTFQPEDKAKVVSELQEHCKKRKPETGTESIQRTEEKTTKTRKNKA